MVRACVEPERETMLPQLIKIESLPVMRLGVLAGGFVLGWWCREEWEFDDLSSFEDGEEIDACN